MRFTIAAAIIVAGLSAAHAADRFAIMQPEQMNAEQKKLFEQLAATLPVDNQPSEKGIFEKVKDYFS